MSEKYTVISSEYESIYNEFFTSVRRDSPKPPAILIRYVEKNINRFYEGFLKGSPNVIFTHQYSWNITYTFLGELYSDLREKCVKSIEWVKFDKKKNEIDVKNTEVFFCLMLVWARMIKKKKGNLDGFGFPKWLKEERFDLFEKDIRCILRKDSNRKGIMYGRTLPVQFFKNQSDVIKFLKGRINDKRILQVIDICKQSSPGWTRTVGFRNLKEFNESVFKMKTSLIGLIGESEVKRKRFLDGTIKKYLMYLGLMATIQTRVERAIEINAAKEMKLFPFYKVLRTVSMSLNFLGAHDLTFCPRVRSRSFIVKIMCRLPKVDKNMIVMNDIETKYWNIKDLQTRREYTSKLSYQAYEYLDDRCNLYQKALNQTYLWKKNRKILYIVDQYGEKHGKLWVNDKYREYNINKSKRNNFHVYKTEFNAKYSTARTYFWADQVSMAS